jgi:DNA-binding transcriptional LysR family regulator
MDRLEAMRAFVRVVQAGSFSAVARELNTTQSTVSKRIAALEDHLGARLILRTTREHSLTQTGSEFYERCLSILSQWEDAQSGVKAQTATPKGVLRVSAPGTLARLHIAPYLGGFMRRYPELTVRLGLTDRHVDLVSEGVDLAVRAKRLEDSTLIARRLAANPMMTVASATYLSRHGEPLTPQDLEKHNCLIAGFLGSGVSWNFSQNGKTLSVPVNGRFYCDDTESLMEMLLDHLGIAILPVWLARPHLDAGRLQEILKDHPPPPLPIHAVYPHSRHVPVKVRVFIDFLIKTFREIPGLDF